MTDHLLEHAILDLIAQRQDNLVALLKALMRIPSERDALAATSR